MERIDKLLCSTGRWSRREVKELVRQGRVFSDGRAVQRPEEKADPGTVCLTVDGQPVDCSPYVYVMLPPELKRRGLFPVGRLDKDTTGLLLLTDNGDLAHRLLSPKKHVDKVYLARVEGRVDAGDVDALAAGMVLADGLCCLPAGLEPLGDGSECRVTLREGKYHQVKRMLAARGKPVVSLHRLQMGPLALDEDLKPGEWRYLSNLERAELLGAGQLQ